MSWRRFLTRSLPLSLLGLALLAEGAAIALNGVPPRRHDLDKLVAALDHARADAPVVVMGDSVTQDVLKTYRIGGSANLTTNQASGVIGSDLLLRRYLERNAAPKAAVIAATPEFFGYQPEGSAARLYVTSVFTRPSEREALAAAGIALDEAWLPAALAIEKRLADPVTGMLVRAPASIPMGDTTAIAGPLEPGPVPDGVAPQIARRAKLSPILSASARMALTDICALAVSKGFTVHLVRAPVPASVRQARSAGWEPDLAAGIKAVCPTAILADFNQSIDFPDHAFRDADHLRRPGWTAAYAARLDALIGELAR